VAAAGPDLIVAGSAVFDGRAPEVNAREMLAVIREGALGGASAGQVSSEAREGEPSEPRGPA
jgi:hypothetical protein